MSALKQDGNNKAQDEGTGTQMLLLRGAFLIVACGAGGARTYGPKESGGGDDVLLGCPIHIPGLLSVEQVCL